MEQLRDSEGSLRPLRMTKRESLPSSFVILLMPLPRIILSASNFLLFRLFLLFRGTLFLSLQRAFPFLSFQGLFFLVIPNGVRNLLLYVSIIQQSVFKRIHSTRTKILKIQPLTSGRKIA